MVSRRQPGLQNVLPMIWQTAIGMDPCEFRMKNCMEDGFVDPANGITFHTYGLKKCMEAGKQIYPLG